MGEDAGSREGDLTTSDTERGAKSSRRVGKERKDDGEEEVLAAQKE